MNRIKSTRTVLSTAALLSLSIAHAGDMGSKPAPVTMPYFGAEASYNWIQRGESRVNDISSIASIQHWGGRISAGLLRLHTEKLGFTGEIGGGYYGNESISMPRLSTTGKSSVDGYDVLVGALYKLEKFDVFGKIGFMIENYRTTTNEANLSQITQGSFITGSTYVRENRTQVLPEVRAGGIYNLREDLGLTLTYMHAFGSTPSLTGSISASQATGINQTIVAKAQNPSLDSILLGLRYYIV
jgi:hypothetical protein